MSGSDSVLLITTAFGHHGDGVWLDAEAYGDRVSSAIRVAATIGSVT
jgi:hypothetical protein